MTLDFDLTNGPNKLSIHADNLQLVSLIGSQENNLSLKAARAAIKDSKDMRKIGWVRFSLLPATCVAVSATATQR